MIIGYGAGQCPDLVRQRDDGGFDRRQQHVLSQRIGHPCGGSDIGDIIRGPGAGALSRGLSLEAGTRTTESLMGIQTRQVVSPQSDWVSMT